MYTGSQARSLAAYESASSEQAMMGPIRVVVADDHPLFREGVITSLNSSDDIEVIAEAADAEGATRAVREHVPDVVLLDVTMPGGGIAAATRIVSSCPSTRIVMLTVSEDEDDLMAAMRAGAQGYVLKGVSSGELSNVVRSVHAGEMHVAASLAGSLLRDLNRPRTAQPLAELSSRERQVLELVAGGLSNQEIGGRLGLAEKTVKHYMTNLLNKLQVRSRVEAALLAARSGIGTDAAPTQNSWRAHTS